MPMLDLRDLRVGYGGTSVLDGLSLTVERGELVCLLGPSGCGKTTALRAVGGYLLPDSGQVLIDGEEMGSRPPELRPVATVFQSYALFPHMTVLDNVTFGLRLQGMGREEREASAREMLETVGMAERAGAYPSELSGGQQQRVALARALVLKPKALLLDEPLSNLDAGLRVRMREEVRAVQRRFDIAMLFVTHDQEEAMAIGDRIALLHHGKVVQQGAPLDVYDHPCDAYCARFLGSVNELRLGDGCTVAFRKEGARLTSDGAFSGRVVQAMFLGSQWEYEIDVDGQVVRVRQDRSLVLKVGDSVRFDVARPLEWKEGA
ncbi:ABC transporter ATP-binding protein [Atopobiaceae bacterium HCP3S3_F7]